MVSVERVVPPLQAAYAAFVEARRVEEATGLEITRLRQEERELTTGVGRAKTACHFATHANLADALAGVETAQAALRHAEEARAALQQVRARQGRTLLQCQGQWNLAKHQAEVLVKTLRRVQQEGRYAVSAFDQWQAEQQEAEALAALEAFVGQDEAEMLRKDARAKASWQTL